MNILFMVNRKDGHTFNINAIYQTALERHRKRFEFDGPKLSPETIRYKEDPSLIWHIYMGQIICDRKQEWFEKRAIMKQKEKKDKDHERSREQGLLVHRILI